MIRYNLFKLLAIMFFISFFYGCAHLTNEQIVKKVQKATRYVDIIIKFNAESYDMDSFESAKKDAVRAENYLKSNNMFMSEYFADNSIKYSSKVLKEYYKDQKFRDNLKNIKEEIESKVADDEDSPLKEYLPDLNNILEYIGELKERELKESVDKVLSDILIVSDAYDSVYTYREKELKSDITFKIGRYYLSKKGKKILEKFTNNLINDIKNFSKEHITKKLQIKIHTIGYTDQIGFSSSRLINKLLEGSNYRGHRSGIRFRKFLNRRLSEFRAKNVNDFIKENLLVYLNQKQLSIKIVQKVEGKGEKIPHNLPKPYKTNDSRRRLCKIYTTITSY